jgi:hypothetical protein
VNAAQQPIEHSALAGPSPERRRRASCDHSRTICPLAGFVSTLR